MKKHRTSYLALLLAACASTPPAAPQPEPPAALQPGRDEAHALTVAAAGVQIYECRAGQGHAMPQWAFVAPEARLFDAQGVPVGRATAPARTGPPPTAARWSAA